MNVPVPTNGQVYVGHAAVGAAASFVAGEMFDRQPFAYIAGFVIGVAAHQYFDVPAAKGIAIATAALT